MSKRWVRMFARLRLHGFRAFTLHKNPNASPADWGVGPRRCCYELGFVRVDNQAELRGGSVQEEGQLPLQTFPRYENVGKLEPDHQ